MQTYNPNKLITEIRQYSDYVNEIRNKFAKEFFLTYYSGEKKKGYNPEVMFHYFVIFIHDKFRIKIDQSIPNNQKEFLDHTDFDGNLTVELKELDEFFNNHVDQENKTLSLNLVMEREEVEP